MAIVIYQGFWRKIDTYEEQPDVHFLHEVIVVLDTDQPERKIAWSTMKNFNQIMINAARVPTIKVKILFVNIHYRISYFDIKTISELRD